MRGICTEITRPIIILNRGQEQPLPSKPEIRTDISSYRVHLLLKRAMIEKIKVKLYNRWNFNVICYRYKYSMFERAFKRKIVFSLQ